jgi:hypothetical protein
MIEPILHASHAARPVLVTLLTIAALAVPVPATATNVLEAAEGEVITCATFSRTPTTPVGPISNEEIVPLVIAGRLDMVVVECLLSETSGFVTVAAWHAHLVQAQSDLERLTETDRIDFSTRRGIRTGLNAIIRWAADQQDWAATHSLQACVEGQQHTWADATEEIEQAVSTLLRGYDQGRARTVDTGAQLFRDAMHDAGFQLGLLLALTDGLVCPAESA